MAIGDYVSVYGMLLYSYGEMPIPSEDENTLRLSGTEHFFKNFYHIANNFHIYDQFTLTYWWFCWVDCLHVSITTQLYTEEILCFGHFRFSYEIPDGLFYTLCSQNQITGNHTISITIINKVWNYHCVHIQGGSKRFQPRVNFSQWSWLKKGEVKSIHQLT